MVKVNSRPVIFWKPTDASLIWTSAPILVSLISFFTFVYQGNQLTVSVAFTVSSVIVEIK
jgi:hypothetical protein